MGLPPSIIMLPKATLIADLHQVSRLTPSLPSIFIMASPVLQERHWADHRRQGRYLRSCCVSSFSTRFFSKLAILLRPGIYFESLQRLTLVSEVIYLAKSAMLTLETTTDRISHQVFLGAHARVASSCHNAPDKAQSLVMQLPVVRSRTVGSATR